MFKLSACKNLFLSLFSGIFLIVLGGGISFTFSPVALTTEQRPSIDQSNFEQQLDKILAKSKKLRNPFVISLAREFKNMLNWTKKSPTKEYKQYWTILVRVPNFESEQYVYGRSWSELDNWKYTQIQASISNPFYDQDTEIKLTETFNKQKDEIAKLKNRLSGSNTTPGAPTNEDLHPIIRKILPQLKKQFNLDYSNLDPIFKKTLQQLAIIVEKAKKSPTKQYAQGWIFTGKLLDSGGEQLTLSLDQVVDFPNQKDYFFTINPSEDKLRLQQLKLKQDELQQQADEITDLQIQIRADLWNTLKNYKIQLSDLLLPAHRVKTEILIKEKDYLQQLRKFVAYINQPENAQNPFSATSPSIKTMINEWFDLEVTTQELSTVLTNYVQAQKETQEEQARKQKEAEKQNKAKEEAEVKKRKQTKLTIGLGVGLGVPILVSGGGLTYWLLRKYCN